MNESDSLDGTSTNVGVVPASSNQHGSYLVAIESTPPKKSKKKKNKKKKSSTKKDENKVTKESKSRVKKDMAQTLSISDDEMSIDLMQQAANSRVKSVPAKRPASKERNSLHLTETKLQEKKVSPTASMGTHSNRRPSNQLAASLLAEKQNLATRRSSQSSSEKNITRHSPATVAGAFAVAHEPQPLSDPPNSDSHEFGSLLVQEQRLSDKFSSGTRTSSTAAATTIETATAHITGAPKPPEEQAPYQDSFCDEEMGNSSRDPQPVQFESTASTDECLVKAEIVGEHTLVVATRETWIKRHQWIVTGGLLIVVVGIIMTFVFTVVDLNPQPDSQPTMAPTTVQQGIAVETAAIIVASLSTLSTALLDESTPQFAALQWVSGVQLTRNDETYSNTRLLQLYSLATLFYSTTSDTSQWLQIDGWLVEANECAWYGVKCTNGLVDALLLGDNGLNGTLPMDLAVLSDHLSAIDLTNNSITGPIPQEYGRLSGLSYLILRKNMLDTFIPSELFEGLKELSFLDLSENSLTSTIPGTIGQLSGLEMLYLGTNSLIGELPSEIGQLRQLERLSVEHNGLAAPLPSELGQLTKLTTLLVMDNALLGPVPSEIGLLESLRVYNMSKNFVFNGIPSEVGSLRQLVHLDWSDNLLTGSLPSVLNQLTQLKSLRLGNNFLQSFGARLEDERYRIFGPMRKTLLDLDLAYNFFQGETLPADVSSLTKLTSLKLNACGLAGSMSELLSQMTALEVLDLSGFNLGGTNIVPTEIGLLTSLKAFNMNESELQGSIPSTIALLTNLELISLQRNNLAGSLWPIGTGNLTNLKNAYLAYNDFTGTLPSNLGLMTDLVKIVIDGNRLSGPVPSQIGLLHSLQLLSISGNFLSGALPSELGYLSSLVELHINLNSFTSSLPSELGLMENLEWISANSNARLSGPLPSDLGRLAKLKSFYFDDTAISGTIPSQFGLMGNLEILVAYRTALLGTVPSEIGQLSSLRALYLNEIELTGTIPSEIGQLSSLESLFFSYTNMEGTLPSEIGQMNKLQDLFLENTGISGSIPTEIGRTQNLASLELVNTNIIGSIPSELGQLDNLTFIWLSNASGMTGTLPTELGALIKLIEVALQNTGLSGSVPTEFGNLAALRILTIRGTTMTGSISSELCDLPPPFPYSRSLQVDCQTVICDCCDCPVTAIPTTSVSPSVVPSSSMVPTSSRFPTSTPSVFPSAAPTSSFLPTSTFSPTSIPSNSLLPTTVPSGPLPSAVPTKSLIPSSSASPTELNSCSQFSSIAETGFQLNVTSFNGTDPICDYDMIGLDLTDDFTFEYLGHEHGLYFNVCPSSGFSGVWSDDKREDFLLEIAVAEFDRGERQLCCGDIYYYIDKDNDVFILSWEGWTMIREDSSVSTFDFQYALHSNGNVEFRWGDGDLPRGVRMQSEIRELSTLYLATVFKSVNGLSFPKNECRLTLAMNDGTYTVV